MKNVLTLAALTLFCALRAAPVRLPARDSEWKIPAGAETKENSFLIRSTPRKPIAGRLRGFRSMRTNTQDKSSVLRRKSAQTASCR